MTYAIRPARQDDLATLPQIEHRAAHMFRSTPYAIFADDQYLVSTAIDLAHEHVWVAVDSHDQPVGFALVHVVDDGTVHLHELDVDPQHARHGLGRLLIDAVAAWARSQHAAALTLATFDDVPWNGPYYTRLGFRTLPLDSLNPALQAVRQAEAEVGLPLDHRLCMQLDL